MTAWGANATPPPGWYPDPEQHATVRWWDGITWTEHRAPVCQPPIGSWVGGSAGPSHDLDYLLPVNRDGYAIASGYLALFSLIPNPLTSTAAIACGWIALRRIPASGKLGRGRAWFGIIVGGLSLSLFLVAVLVAN